MQSDVVPAEAAERVATAVEALRVAATQLELALGVGSSWPWRPLADALEFVDCAIDRLEAE